MGVILGALEADPGPHVAPVWIMLICRFRFMDHHFMNFKDFVIIIKVVWGNDHVLQVTLQQ